VLPIRVMMPTETILPRAPGGYGSPMAQWRIELTTQDVVALSRGSEVTVTAIDEEQGLAEETIEVTISLLDL
jgi:hypothetical protein